MMHHMKLGPLLVMTPDMDAAERFYRDALGLRLAGRFDGHLVFDLGGAPLHVFRCERAAPAGDHGRVGGSVITFEVPSIDQATQTLKAKGVTFLHETPAVNPDARFHYAAFDAPGGNVHELVESF